MWFDYKTSNVCKTLRDVQKDVQKDRKTWFMASCSVNKVSEFQSTSASVLGSFAIRTLKEFFFLQFLLTYIPKRNHDKASSLINLKSK